MNINEDYIKGRGAQVSSDSRFNKLTYGIEHWEGIDEHEIVSPRTQVFVENARTLVNKVNSPDIPGMYSMNPYQGCEHGCIYCYARNAHHYYGFGSGLDFESKIVVKMNAAEALEKQFRSRTWKPAPIMLAGNTDCYQPLERKYALTRSLLEVCLKFKHPVGIITKNALILRDTELLQELASHRLVHVMFSINSLNEDLRRVMEPRTATATQRLHALKTLNDAGIPAGVMVAPIIPSLNSDEIPAVLAAAGEAGAQTAGYTTVRLNGSLGDLFRDWLDKNFPDRADKVWNHICELHGGQVNDSRYGSRMKGTGEWALMISRMFKIAKARHIKTRPFEYNSEAFAPPPQGQLKFF